MYSAHNAQFKICGVIIHIIRMESATCTDIIIWQPLSYIPCNYCLKVMVDNKKMLQRIDQYFWSHAPLWIRRDCSKCLISEPICSVIITCRHYELSECIKYFV